MDIDAIEQRALEENRALQVNRASYAPWREDVLALVARVRELEAALRDALDSVEAYHGDPEPPPDDCGVCQAIQRGRDALGEPR